MKKTFTLAFVSATIVAGIVFSQMKFEKQSSTLLLDNIEALAGDEYHQGQSGTNWETYTITCVAYGESSDNWFFKSGSYISVERVEVGADYTVGGGSSTNFESYEFSKDVCGYGAGLCLSSAPSGHPCA